MTSGGRSVRRVQVAHGHRMLRGRGGTVDRYPNISDHGIIGDLQTAALVAADGTVDFFCCPRFDSPSVFASLLDAERGGYFKISPAGEEYVTRQLYFPDTAMLITRFGGLHFIGAGFLQAQDAGLKRCPTASIFPLLRVNGEPLS